MRGRTPKPAGTKLAQGNPGRRPIGSDPVGAEVDHAGAPAWLNVQAREVWAQLEPELRKLRLLSRADVLTFARYCELFGLWMQAREKLAAGDVVVTTVSEHVTMDRLNKNLHAMLLIEKRLVDQEDRFGLNPALRQGIFAKRAAAASGAPGELFGEEVSPKSSPTPSGPIGLLN